MARPKSNSKLNSYQKKLKRLANKDKDLAILKVDNIIPVETSVEESPIEVIETPTGNISVETENPPVPELRPVILGLSRPKKREKRKPSLPKYLFN